MKKRVIALACALVLALSLPVASFAAASAPSAGYGWCGGVGGGGFMRDDSGNLLDREAFEERLDQYIEDGIIAAEDKDAYLEQYDYCAEYGGGFGCGRGMGRGCRI